MFLPRTFQPLDFPICSSLFTLVSSGEEPRPLYSYPSILLHRVDDFIHHRYLNYRYLSLISYPLIKDSSSGIHLIFLKFSLNYLPLLTPEFTLLSMLASSINPIISLLELLVHPLKDEALEIIINLEIIMPLIPWKIKP